MTEKKFKSISDNLTIAQAMMISLGVPEIEIFEILMSVSPFEVEDEEYFETVIDTMNEMCVQNEFYEVCTYLIDIRKNVREN